MGRSRNMRVDDGFYDYVNAIHKKSGIPIVTITKKLASDRALVAIRKGVQK